VTAPLRVGLNLIFLVPGETGGMETYARELVSELRTFPGLELTVFLNRETEAEPGPWSDLNRVTVPVRARRRAEWVWGEQVLLPRLAAHAGVEILHSLGSTAPATGRYRRVVTILDLIYKRYPEAHSGLRSRAMGVLVPLAARRSDRIVAPSEATRDDLVELLHAAPDKIDVTLLGVRAPGAAPPGASEQLRERLRLGTRPVVLTVAARRPHKNLMRLLEALALIPAERRPVLVLPGYATQWDGRLAQRTEDLGVGADVRFLGWVSDDELEALYAAASCLVLPSLYEGFGLPVLDAMVRGVPVACSDRGSLREVAGDAALIFDPERPEAIAGAIETLLSDSTTVERLRKAGRAHAAAFTWAETARRTAEVYRRLAP
jgi:glycosyltransferase involved in cell wall biosynthesis